MTAQLGLEMKINEGRHEIDPHRVLDDAAAMVIGLNQFVRHFSSEAAAGLERVSVASISKPLLQMTTCVPGDIQVNIHDSPEAKPSLYMPLLFLRHLVVPVILNAADALASLKAPAKRIDVQFQRLPKKTDFMISVGDNGPGWLGMKEKLIESFNQGARVSTKSKHRGYGLSNIHRLLAKLGGSLELADVPSGGAQVNLVLPVHWL